MAQKSSWLSLFSEIRRMPVLAGSDYWSALTVSVVHDDDLGVRVGLRAARHIIQNAFRCCPTPINCNCKVSNLCDLFGAEQVNADCSNKVTFVFDITRLRVHTAALSCGLDDNVLPKSMVSAKQIGDT
jgi:hypothetical protein